MTCINKRCSTTLYNNALYCHVCGKEQSNQPGGPGKKKRGNGQGSVFMEKGKWTARVLKYWYVDDNGKYRPKFIYKTGFATKTEAIKHIPILESNIHLKNKEKKKVPTLTDLWRLYEKASLPRLSKDKQVAYKGAKKKLENIFHTPINLLTIEDLQDAIDSKASTFYPAKDMKTVVSHLYNLAVPEGHVNVNLSEYVKLPELIEKEARKFSKEEQTALWTLYENNDKFVRYILLMIYTGMMPGELQTIKKVNVDLKTQTINYGLKTNKRKKTPMIMPDEIIPVITDILSDDGDKLIHINKDKFYEQYYACLKRAGCDTIPPYSCRHTTGSTLGVSDIPAAIFKELMRHEKFASTERYIHIDAGDTLDAANKARKPPM